jgi:hypothetical protein
LEGDFETGEREGFFGSGLAFVGDPRFDSESVLLEFGLAMLGAGFCRCRALQCWPPVYHILEVAPVNYSAVAGSTLANWIRRVRQLTHYPGREIIH